MRSTSAIVAVVVVVALAAVSALGLGLTALHDRDPRPSVWGVRLGMTATQLRARIEERGAGTWTTRLESGDWILERTGPGEPGTAEHATFELHDGQLVAVRAEGPITDDAPAAPAYETTEGSVLIRDVAGDRVQTTLLSRTCPTHRDEAERLVRERAPHE